MPAVDRRRITLRVDKVVAGGDGLGREDTGRVVLVTGALPGELVVAEIDRERRDVAFARTVEVIEPTAARRTPPCPAVERGCGGCGWQHVEVDAQRELKRQIVVEALERTGRIADPAVTVAPALPDERYRTTVRLAVDAEGRVGFRAARRHDVVAVTDCLVAHPLLSELLGRLRLPAGEEIVLRVGAATAERAAWWTPAQLARPASLPDDVQTGRRGHVHEVVGGRRLRVGNGAFFQPSREAAEAIVDAVRRSAGPARDWPAGAVVDAYGGVGLFAATVVPADRPVVVVESAAPACADAAVNLAGHRAEVVNRQVESWQPCPAALVIADPARAGLGRQAAQRLAATGTPLLVLVSCDPVSLARDAGLLREHGYRLAGAEVIDTFPNTTHVEVVSRFERVGAG